jgi:hypothetical protein
MSTAPSAIDIEYPESDGRPMGETDLHRNWMIHLIDVLQTRYREAREHFEAEVDRLREELRQLRGANP